MYHEGEIEVQSRAGVRQMADRVGGSIRSFLPPAALTFLPQQRFAVVGSRGPDGRVWASVLTGRPGFLSAPDATVLQIGAHTRSDDPLWENLVHDPQIGVLVLDPATRRRMRVNGKAELSDEGLLVHVGQAYSNCPQYIQMRVPEQEEEAKAIQRHSLRSSDLSAAAKAWIARADTFFLATYHPKGGADASHRGGMPGFIRLEGENALVWPDYVGNNMFQSLGNLAVYPRAGLVFADFESGRTLQLTGEACVVWDAARTAQFPGAKRLVEFNVNEALETESAFVGRWRLVEYSPINPKIEPDVGSMMD